MVAHNWSDIFNFVYGKVTGTDKGAFTDEEAVSYDACCADILHNLTLDDVREDVEKLLKLNVLDKKVNFKIFDNMPNIWSIIYEASSEIVSDRYIAKN